MQDLELFKHDGFPQLLFEGARDALLIEDENGRILEVNTRMEELFGYSREELIEMESSELEAPESKKKQAHKETAYPESTEGSLFETVGLTKDGKKIPLEIAISSLVQDNGTYYLLIIRDITDRKRAEEELFRMANIDPLTELPNRRYMQKRMEDEKARSERSGKPFALIMSDIDDFKMFNDNHGHECGDYILVQISKLISSMLRKQDIVSRWGGEEFLFLLPETGRKGAVKTADKIRDSIDSADFEYIGNNLHLTMTFGIAECRGYDEIKERIKAADTALLLGKNKGKNNVITLSK